LAPRERPNNLEGSPEGADPEKASVKELLPICPFELRPQQIMLLEEVSPQVCPPFALIVVSPDTPETVTGTLLSTTVVSPKFP
jgi:hypothetical protein